ncbi:MAG: cytochrome c [Verrucomicrobiota bacterium]
MKQLESANNSAKKQPHLSPRRVRPLANNPLPQGEEDAKRQVRVGRKRQVTLTFGRLTLALVCLVDLAGCELTNQAPPAVTSRITHVGKKGVNPSPGLKVSLVSLREGRVLFASRCIECHTLPPVWYYKRDDWPGLVDTMAQRAHLKPGERDAIVAYILATREQ